MLPAPSFIRALILRGIVIWFPFKAAAVVITASRRAPWNDGPVSWREALQLAPTAMVALAAFVALLTLIDARRRNELVFLGNMGVSRAAIAAVAAAPALLAEIILASVL